MDTDQSSNDALIRGTIKAIHPFPITPSSRKRFPFIIQSANPLPKHEMNYEFILFVHYLGDWCFALRNEPPNDEARATDERIWCVQRVGDAERKDVFFISIVWRFFNHTRILSSPPECELWELFD